MNYINALRARKLAQRESAIARARLSVSLDEVKIAYAARPPLPLAAAAAAGLLFSRQRFSGRLVHAATRVVTGPIGRLVLRFVGTLV
jgi:hypothetical protein